MAGDGWGLCLIRKRAGGTPALRNRRHAFRSFFGLRPAVLLAHKSCGSRLFLFWFGWRHYRGFFLFEDCGGGGDTVAFLEAQ
jgi:hypothetical protein